MGPTQFILLIALAALLGTWGLVQLVIAFLDRDKTKIQNRLASEWRANVQALANQSIRLNPEFNSLPKWMGDSPFFRNLQRDLTTAYSTARLTPFLCICGIIGLLAFMFISLAFESLLAGLIAGAGVAYLPVLFIHSRKTRRQHLLADQLPEALDFLCRILKAGHSFSTGLQMMGEELPQPIGGEFRRCYDQHSLGQSLEEALREMIGRIDSPDFAFFVTAVLIQRQTGGDLSEVLSNISTMIRARIRLHHRVKALTAEGRLTGYILFAFPAVLFAISYFLNPQYSSVLINTDAGKMLLAAAVGLQFTGLFAIRKIVNVRP